MQLAVQGMGHNIWQLILLDMKLFSYMTACKAERVLFVLNNQLQDVDIRKLAVMILYHHQVLQLGGDKAWQQRPGAKLCAFFQEARTEP